MKTHKNFLFYLAHFISEWEIFQTKFVEKIKKNTYLVLYRVSQEEWTKLRESVPYVKIYRYNPKHLYPKLNG